MAHPKHTDLGQLQHQHIWRGCPTQGGSHRSVGCPLEIAIQVGEFAQIRRYTASQLPIQVQPLQVGEAAKLRGYLAAQLVAG